MQDGTENDRVHRLATLRERLDPDVDRREFLRTLVNAGYALGVASLLGVEDFLAAEHDYVPIVTALVRDDPEDPSSLTERTKYVPAEWYAAITKAFEAHDLVAETSIPGYLASAVTPSEYTSPGAAISIDVSAEDADGAAAAIEGLVDGVSLSVDAIEGVEEELEEGSDAGEPHLLDEIGPDGVPGGVACQTPGPTTASLMPALHHPDADRPFFATAHHAYVDVEEPMGEPLHLPLESGDRERLGQVAYEHREEDVIVIEPDEGMEPAGRIRNADAGPVVGQYTRLGLADLAARGEPLEKVGAMTGHTTGQIDGIDAITCLTDDFCRHGQLKWGEEEGFTDGDSGSVSYHADPEQTDDGILIASVNNARTWWPGQNYVWGVAAYRLTNEYGYHF